MQPPRCRGRREMRREREIRSNVFFSASSSASRRLHFVLFSRHHLIVRKIVRWLMREESKQALLLVAQTRGDFGREAALVIPLRSHPRARVIGMQASPQVLGFVCASRVNRAGIE